jgi:ADP-ribose pyrophosphatase
MTRRERLDPPPEVAVEVVRDRTAETRPDEGFLRVRRLVLRNRYADGTSSEPYRYDIVERDALDAVGIVLESANEHDGEPWVCLRSALRPPMAFRREHAVPVEREHPASLWEIPAGLVEPDERGEEGLRSCASRETLEEVGLEVPADRFARLGPSFALSPGVLGEKLFLLHAIVDPDGRGEPTLDGSPTEEAGVVRFVPLREALDAVREGRIADVKTEVALRRLAELRGLVPRHGDADRLIAVEAAVDARRESDGHASAYSSSTDAADAVGSAVRTGRDPCVEVLR